MYIATVDYQSPDAKIKFTQSLKDSGFAVLINHPLDWSQIQAIYDEWLVFFRSEHKKNYLVSSHKKGGLFSTALSETAKGETKKDPKEFFHIFKTGVYPLEVSNNALCYYDQAHDLAKQLLGWIQQQSPVDVQQLYSEPLPNMIEGSESLLRILRYTPIASTQDYVRAAAHEDINLITILPAATAKGLQVKNKAGEWLDIPVEPNSLIINIGDMLQEASQGYYPSTTHRVIKHKNDVELERISMPFFLQPRPDVVLSKRYTAGQYHTERMQELKVIQDGKVLV
ncbi:isopenicillin N synthase family oxygenase [Acinetobacter rathckeae]|uniref:isopenicillin N synthase family oxygenase n=1 Tax=Acinetobacter rathckeae TaxID=2605272 RepID=UPI0018A2D5DF|nr:isopenicillin N synthase family oxygenase [Acinetobacter rathckeae]MBF7687115.1 isopenicillin N synthase family oxygenase [Acinetobacter rathckeae]MBF7694533.1 isopenicillin N synthase family oxygenase [Acinetobacter rathckeae]